MHVTATRSGRWWALQCVEHPGALSQVARLDKAAGMIREAIAFVADVEPDSFDIEVVPVLPERYRSEAALATRARSDAQAANAAAARHSREAARALVGAGMSLRDVGTVMGVSHQRAAQLATGSAP